MKYDTPYKEQLNRVKRLRNLVKQFAIATNDNFEEALDLFTSFFIQCYHLRDWLIESSYPQSQVDSFIKQSTWLSLCRNLANKQKHKEIKRYKPQNSFVQHEGFGVSTPITRYHDPIKNENRFGIDVWEFGMPVDVVEVADKCIEEWSNFLAFRTERYLRKKQLC